MCWKKITIFFVIAALAVPALFVPTKRAEAFFGCTPTITPPTPLGPFVPVYDAATAVQLSFSNTYQSSNFSKECILDALVTMLGQSLINNLTGSIVDWINSDFEGGPAFVTDPAGFFVNIADETAGNFIETQLGPIGQLLCSPFDLRLRLNLWLSTSASRKQYIGCRLTDIQMNIHDAFTSGGFIANGGWRTFNAMTSDPRNNQFGAYILASDALNMEFIKKANEKLRELSQGRGFLSYKKCVAYSPATNASGGHDCARYEVQTPGSLINNQLENVFGSELRKFELADEINEVFQALVNYGLRQVFSSTGGGLRGASKISAGESESATARARRLGDFNTLYANVQSSQSTKTEEFQFKVTSEGVDDSTRKEINKQQNNAGAVGSQSTLGRNLAINQTATQSGFNKYGYEAEQAINGDKIGYIDDCSGTRFQRAANVSKVGGNLWWRVNLQDTSYVKEVRIYKAGGCGGPEALGELIITLYKSADQAVTTITPPVSSSSAPSPLIIQINAVGKDIQIQRKDGEFLYLAEVEVYGTEGTTPPVGSAVVPASGVSVEPSPIPPAPTGGNTTPTLAASANVEVKTNAAVFTINEPLNDARIGVLMTKKESGIFKNFAPGQAFSKILVRVKNETTGEIKLEEEFVNNEPKTYKTQKTFSAVAGERIAVGYEFTPTGATRGQTYGLITEITNTGGIQISGAVSTININIPN